MKIKSDLKNLYQYFARHPESSWIMVWSNAQELYKFIRNNEVKNILDLGTGIGLSAAVMALAFKEKGVTDYHIDSIEQYDKCVKLAGELIPKDLKTNITIHKANVVVWETEKIPRSPFSIFDKIPDQQYDLIVNDGPGPFMEDGHLIDLPNGTIHKFLLEDKIKPGSFVIFDGRIKALKSLDRHFGNNFYIQIRPESDRDFNVLERKDNSVVLEDDLIKAMTPMGYFHGL